MSYHKGGQREQWVRHSPGNNVEPGSIPCTTLVPQKISRISEQRAKRKPWVLASVSLIKEKRKEKHRKVFLWAGGLFPSYIKEFLQQSWKGLPWLWESLAVLSRTVFTKCFPSSESAISPGRVLLHIWAGALITSSIILFPLRTFLGPACQQGQSCPTRQPKDLVNLREGKIIWTLKMCCPN